MAWAAIVMFLVFFVEVPALFRHEMYRELLVFGFLWVLAFVYVSFTVLDVPLPTVVETVKYFFGWFHYYP